MITVYDPKAYHYLKLVWTLAQIHDPITPDEREAIEYVKRMLKL